MLAFIDYIAPYIMLERVIGRAGCVMAGYCYGSKTKLPWAMDFGDGVPRHPSQVYEMIYSLAIFASVAALYPKLRVYKGITISFVIALYSLMRFFNEFIRVESPAIFGPFHYAHLTMLLFFMVSAGCFFLSGRKPQSLRGAEGDEAI